MSNLEVSSFLNRAYANLSEGMGAEGKGLFENAAEKYLVSAENLLLAARMSTGTLKIVRVENAEFLIDRAEELKRKASKAKLMTSGRCGEAFKMLEELGLGVSAEIPKVTLDEVAGMERVKSEIKVKVIYPLKYPDIASEHGMKVGGGILLYGPPGTGKTHMARAIANEVDALFVPIKPQSLLSQWFGVFEKKISQVFEAARLCSPSIIFIDEIDAMAPKRRSSSSSVMKRAVPTLLTELDGIDKRNGVSMLIVGATNNPWDLDEAIFRPGRFDEKIYVPPPNFEARRMIFELNLRDRRCPAGLDLNLAAERTEGYSGADIRYICRRVAEKVFKDAVERGVRRAIEMSDLIEAIEEVSPSIPESLLKKFEKFSDKRSVNK